MASNQDNDSEIRKQLAELPGRNMKCDLMLEVGDRSFPARKDVLILRMVYFRAMFTAEMQEKDMMLIKLDSSGTIVDPTAFDDILEYVYTLNITLTKTNLESIYKAVDFFCFDELKAKTEHFMKININKDNVSVFLDIAMKFNLKTQEEQCKQFIIANPISVSKTRHEVRYLNFTELSSLLQKLCELSEFEDMFHSSMEWILYDKRNRSERVSELLQLIPLRRLSSEFCKKVISKNTIVMNDMKCTQLLIESLIGDPSVEELYVFGGRDGTALSSMSKYDSSTRRWIELASMPTKLSHFAYCVVNQEIYVCGGHNGEKDINDLFMFNTNSHKWSIKRAMKYPRDGCGMAVLDGHLYVAGGWNDTNQHLSVVERYSIQNDKWTTVSSMINKRFGLELVQLNGSLYALGGQDGTNVHKSVEQYNPKTGKWTVLADMGPYVYFGSAALNNRIYVVGRSFCEEYNPEGDEWRIMTSPTKCQNGRRLAVFDGKLVAIGGRIDEGKDWKGRKTVEYYDFEKRSWIITKDMNIARCHHGVAVVTRKYIHSSV